MRGFALVFLASACVACGAGTPAATPDVLPDASADTQPDPGSPGELPSDGDPGQPDQGSWDAGLQPPMLTPDPAVLDLGPVRKGCYSKRFQACFRNDVNRAVTLEELDAAGCPPTFRLKYDALPVDLAPGDRFCADVSYVALATGVEACLLTARILGNSGDAPHVILVGQAVPGDEVVDEFMQVSGQEVDLLFAIDDSPSMCAYQDKLRAALETFAGNAAAWHDDIHLGVISLEGTDPAKAGLLNRGAAVTPLFLDQHGGASFVDRFLLGCAGTPDGSEQGLAALQKALTLGGTGPGCDDDAECAWRLCDEDPACPYKCVDQVCTGPNGGFLRDFAQLEIFVITDADDHSPGEVSEYTYFLKNLKGYYNTNMMHLNAILAPETGCPAAPGPLESRYAQVVDETNGRLGSLCDPATAWSYVLNGIGSATFVLKTQYFLSRLADPDTIHVFLDGQECLDGWKYDLPSNAILFDHEGPCMPQENQKVTVKYRTLCLTS